MNNTKQLSDDALTLIFVGMFLGPTILAALAARLPEVELWLVERGVLVGHALLPLTPTGAGLDLNRLVMVAAVIVILLVVGVNAVRQRGEEEEEVQA